MERERALEIVKKSYSPDGVDDTLKRALETLIPELAESEDERIRKEIKHHISLMEFYRFQKASKKECLAYLEKLKDIEERWLKDREGCFWDGVAEGREQKEQTQISNIIAKAFENSKTDYSLEEREKSSDYSERVLPTSITYGEDEDEYKLHKVIEAAYIAGQTSQKPAEYLDKDKVYAIMTKLTNLSCSTRIPINSDEYKKINEITGDVRRLLDYPIEQKPALSEEDEKIRKEIMVYIDWLDGKKDCQPKGAYSIQDMLAWLIKQKPAEWSEENEDKLYQIIETLLADKEVARQENPQHYDVLCKAYDELISWLKSLPLNLKKKNEDVAKLCSNEWSEEDERMLTGIIERGSSQIPPYEPALKEEQMEWLMKRLKSLRPQAKQEWDTHDKAIVNCIVCCLDGQFVTEGARKQCLEWFNKHRRDFLNSPSWKPSEEQMEVLWEVYRGGKDQEPLRELYEQLKKLKEE